MLNHIVNVAIHSFRLLRKDSRHVLFFATIVLILTGGQARAAQNCQVNANPSPTEALKCAVGLQNKFANGENQAQAAVNVQNPVTSLLWKTASAFDTGNNSSVAVLPTGLVVEVHRSPNNGMYWYHLGQLQKDVDGNWSMSWGPSQRVPTYSDGDAPSLAVTNKGYVVFVWSRYDALYYGVGRVSPTGGTDQLIDWMVQDYKYDNGYRPSIATTGNGDLVEAHEAPAGGGHALYLRTGTMENASIGDFHIHWTSGKSGLKYDAGVVPHIAMNDIYQLVEVHQVTGEHLLHYRRGEWLQTNVGFWPSQRYDNDSAKPADALTLNGTVIELHVTGSRIYSRTGTLPKNSSGLVTWSPTVSELGLLDKTADLPAIATNGHVAIATWESKDTLYWSVAPLQ
jgi:hypothetical protein